MSPQYQIELQSPTNTLESGQSTTTYTTERTLLVNIKDDTESQKVEFGQKLNYKGYTINLRQQPDLDITERWRIVYDSRELYIHSIKEFKKRYLEIKAYQKIK